MIGSVTFVVGLAGSGKSHYVATHSFDWAHDEGFMAAGKGEANHRALVRAIRRGERCAVAELQLLNRYVQAGYLLRLRRDVPGVRVRWVFFENNLKAANWNCRHRKNKPGDRRGRGHIKMNESHAPYYYIPPGRPVRKIHKVRAS